MDVRQKVIIVTGASAGIGLATARLLAKEGASVALAARSREKLQELSRELPGSFAIPTDMSDASQVEHMIAAVQVKPRFSCVRLENLTKSLVHKSL
jgi:NADP-dependent 3-hydroxy acid dehydrogenase YdfG